MKKIIMLVLVSLLAFGTVACATSTPEPTFIPPTQPPPQPTATRVPPTNTAVPPTAAPTATAVPPTRVPPTNTAVPPTVAPTAVPTATAVPPTAVPPGLFVTNVKVMPERPAFNQDVTFAANFQNTAAGEQNIRWAVYIFKADEATKSNNETTIMLTTFPVGAKEFNATGSFRYGPTGRTCEYFFARVGLTNSEGKIVWLNNTDGKMYEKGFQVCDVATIPTLPPGAPAPTAVPPTPKPGLFVNDLRIQPAPVRGADLTFFPTFSNTSGGQMTFTWRVVIFKADNLNTSYSETTWLQTNFPTNPGEIKSDGTWKLALGGPCENFVARVGWRDANNYTQFFLKPDGKVFEKSFAVCPP